MPEDFDPYRKWLGIPAKDQPPHHYRLLNIEPFEKDADVISNAADARTAQLKQYQSGEHAEAAKKIGKEIVEARVCLLNGKKRAAYDKQLRSQLKSDRRKSLPMAAPLSAGTDSAGAGIPSFGSPSVAAHVSDRSGRKKKQPVAVIVVGAATAVAILVALGMFLTQNKDKDVAKQPGTARPADAPGAQPADPAGISDPGAVSDPTDPAPPTPSEPSGIPSQPNPGASVAEIFGLDKPEPSLGELIHTDPDEPGELTATPEPGKVVPPATAQHGLLGEYFADKDLTRKVLTRVDPQIQFKFDYGSPDPQVPKDFAARWTGWLVAPEAGNYKLSTVADDGVRLWLDGELLIDRWTTSSGTRDEVDVVLTDRPHAIKIEYFDYTANAIMQLSWSRPGVFEEQPVPTEALLVDAGSTATAALPEPGEPSASSEPPDPSGPPAAVQPPAEQLAVPDSATRQKIQADVKEIFQEELAKATTAEAKAAMATALFEQAKANNDDPNARFVLLQMACNMAAEAGNVAQAIEIVDQMERQYTINPLSVRAHVLKQATESMPSGSTGLTAGEQIVDAATALADQCGAAGNYDAAAGFSDLAITAARKTKDSSLMQLVMVQDREIKRKKARFASIKKALDTLSTRPDDPGANLTAGRWYCFNRDDWAKGLPLLAKGSDENLAAVARQEMKAPTDSASLVTLADGWYDQAEKEKNESASAVRSHAKFYYEQALPSLDGLTRVKVKKRLESIAEADKAAAEAAVAAKPKEIKRPERGVVQPGNVALTSNGTTITGGGDYSSYAPRMIDGSLSTYGYARHPCEWTITFDKVYRLKAIAFRIHSYSSSSSSSRYKPYARYAVAISADGTKYFPLFNASQGQWRGWQRIPVPNRPVKAVKLYGLYNSYSSRFYVDEFEAYCVIPGAGGK